MTGVIAVGVVMMIMVPPPPSLPPSLLLSHLMQIEGWSFIEALYWALVTITTVGFGDVVPETHGGKAFTILFCLVGCTVLAWSVNSLIRYPLVMKAKQSELRVMMQFGGQLSEETLRSILANNFFDRIPNLRQREDSVTKSEFILLLLSMMSKINDKDLLIASKIFDMLDDQKQSQWPSLSVSVSLSNSLCLCLSLPLSLSNLDPPLSRLPSQIFSPLRISFLRSRRLRREKRSTEPRRRYDSENSPPHRQTLTLSTSDPSGTSAPLSRHGWCDQSLNTIAPLDRLLPFLGQ
jgi:hypothetical protein